MTKSANLGWQSFQFSTRARLRNGSLVIRADGPIVGRSWVASIKTYVVVNFFFSVIVTICDGEIVALGYG